MSESAAASDGALPGPPEESPREIRTALPGAERAEFDREYRRVMREATESLDLTDVRAFLRRWRRIAWTTRDRAAHQQVLDRAEALVRGERVATEPWERTRAQLGL